MWNSWEGTDVQFHAWRHSCHRSKAVKEYPMRNKITVLNWHGNSPVINPKENMWTLLMDEIAEKHPSSSQAVIEAIVRYVCCSDISCDHCNWQYATSYSTCNKKKKTEVGSIKYWYQCLVEKRVNIHPLFHFLKYLQKWRYSCIFWSLSNLILLWFC